jgi:hypothetical protein
MKVASAGEVRDPPEARASGHAGDPGPAHEQLDRTATDDETLAQDEFGMDAPSPIAAPALEVDSADQLGEECVPDRPGRRRTTMLGVVARLRDREHATSE